MRPSRPVLGFGFFPQAHHGVLSGQMETRCPFCLRQLLHLFGCLPVLLAPVQGRFRKMSRGGFYRFRLLSHREYSFPDRQRSHPAALQACVWTKYFLDADYTPGSLAEEGVLHQSEKSPQVGNLEALMLAIWLALMNGEGGKDTSHVAERVITESTDRYTPELFL